VHGASSAASPGIKTGAEVSADYKGGSRAYADLRSGLSEEGERKEKEKEGRRKSGLRENEGSTMGIGEVPGETVGS